MSDDKIDIILEKLASIESKLDRLASRLDALEMPKPQQPAFDNERATEILEASLEAEQRRANLLSTSQNVVNLSDINALLQQ